MNWEDLSKELAYIIYRMYDGDIVENALDRLKQVGYLDENYEWIDGQDG